MASEIPDHMQAAGPRSQETQNQTLGFKSLGRLGFRVSGLGFRVINCYRAPYRKPQFLRPQRLSCHWSLASLVFDPTSYLTVSTLSAVYRFRALKSCSLKALQAKPQAYEPQTVNQPLYKPHPTPENLHRTKPQAYEPKTLKQPLYKSHKIPDTFIEHPKRNMP